MAEVLLVEPWFGGSHKSWAQGYERFSSHDVRIVSLPDLGWKWRLRGSAARLAELAEADATANGTPDVVLVSGLTDVAALRGLLPFSIPIVTFMHESQMLYPNDDGALDVENSLTNLLSWLASTEVWFNSRFHRDSVCSALPAFTATIPEEVRPTADPTPRFQVTGLGVDLDWVKRRVQRKPGPPRILWPHRWQQDKNPEVFLSALRKLQTAGAAFELILAGEDGPKASQTKSEIINTFDVKAASVGPFNRKDYLGHLSDADIVASCASHEFFGVGVVEAIAAGCHPVLPNNLSYPELIPPALRSQFLYPLGTFGTALGHALDTVHQPESLAARTELCAAAGAHSWQQVAPIYDARISAILGGIDQPVA